MASRTQKLAFSALAATALGVAAVAATRERAPSPDQRDELEELARRVADAESGLGIKGQSPLGGALVFLRGYGYAISRLSLRINALSGEVRMDPDILREITDTLDDLVQFDSRINSGRNE